MKYHKHINIDNIVTIILEVDQEDFAKERGEGPGGYKYVDTHD